MIIYVLYKLFVAWCSVPCTSESIYLNTDNSINAILALSPLLVISKSEEIQLKFRMETIGYTENDPLCLPIFFTSPPCVPVQPSPPYQSRPSSSSFRPLPTLHDLSIRDPIRGLQSLQSTHHNTLFALRIPSHSLSIIEDFKDIFTLQFAYWSFMLNLDILGCCCLLNCLWV